MMQLIHDIFRVLRPKEKMRFRWLTAAGIFVNIADIGSIAGLLIVIRFYMQPGSLPYKWIPVWLSDPAQPALALAFLVFFAVKNAAAYFIQQAQNELSYDVALRLSHDLLLRYYASPFPEKIAIDSSVSSRRISQQPIEFGHHVLGSLQQVFTQTILVLFAVVAILLYNTSTFLLLLMILMPPVLGAGWWLKRKTKQLRASGRKYSEDASKHLREALAGHTDVQMYNAGEFFMLRYLQQQSKQNKHLSSLQNIQAMPSRLIEVFAILGLVLLILLRNQQAVGGLDLMITGAFLGAAYRIIPGAVKILNSTAQMRAYAFTIPELLPVALPRKTPSDAEPIRSVRFSNIVFHTDPEQTAFSAVLHAGKLTGISGPSGSGKTTLLNYLLGFNQPLQGKIIFNEGAVASCRSQVAYVPQQTVLLHDTIRENITLGRMITDPARLDAILDITGMRTWTDSLLQKLETIITEKGGNISGGQAQRIIIARALLEEKEMYLLDEPFNELDAPSVQQLLHYFRLRAREGKTVVLVTHDRTCLEACDEIISLHG